jgi:hypothetical protein
MIEKDAMTKRVLGVFVGLVAGLFVAATGSAAAAPPPASDFPERDGMLDHELRKIEALAAAHRALATQPGSARFR